MQTRHETLDWNNGTWDTRHSQQTNAEWGIATNYRTWMATHPHNTKRRCNAICVVVATIVKLKASGHDPLLAAIVLVC